MVFCLIFREVVRHGRRADVLGKGTVSSMDEAHRLQESGAHQHLKWKGIAKDIKDVAENFSCPISEVEKIMSTEIQQLEQGAHVKDFVPLLAIKKVKDMLRSNRRTSSRPEQRDQTHSQLSHHQRA
jgi:hypothetical protein